MFRQLIKKSSKAVTPLFFRNNARVLATPSLFPLRCYNTGQEKAAQTGSFLPKDEVLERVIKVVRQHPRLTVQPEKVVERSHFINDLKLDSLDTTEIVMEVEEEFGIEIPEEEAFKFNTVGEVVKYISEHPMAK